MSGTNMTPNNNVRQGRHRLTFAVWRNPLGRPADRVQAGALLLAFGLWVIGLPIAAAMGSLIWSNISVTAEHQQHTRTLISGHLLADAPDFVISDHGIPVTDLVPVAAQWSAPDGTQRTGTVTAAGGGRAFDPVAVWIDQSGAPTKPPTSTTASAVSAVSAATGIWLCSGSVLLLLWLILRRRLDKQRATDWDRQWESVEPLWTGR